MPQADLFEDDEGDADNERGRGFWCYFPFWGRKTAPERHNSKDFVQVRSPPLSTTSPCCCLCTLWPLACGCSACQWHTHGRTVHACGGATRLSACVALCAAAQSMLGKELGRSEPLPEEEEEEEESQRRTSQADVDARGAPALARAAHPVVPHCYYERRELLEPGTWGASLLCWPASPLEICCAQRRRQWRACGWLMRVRDLLDAGAGSTVQAWVADSSGADAAAAADGAHNGGTSARSEAALLARPVMESASGGAALSECVLAMEDFYPALPAPPHALAGGRSIAQSGGSGSAAGQRGAGNALAVGGAKGAERQGDVSRAGGNSSRGGSSWRWDDLL